MRQLLILVLALSGLVWMGVPLASADDGLQLQPPVPGATRSGFDHGAGRYGTGHRGVDLSAATGDPIRASADGVVFFSGMVAGRPTLSIDHGNGLRTTYTPARASVAEGEPVAAGEVVGRVGMDAHCAGQCLHWGLTDGVDHFDPLAYLAVPRIRLVPHGWRPPARPSFGAAVALAGERPVDGAVTSRFGPRVHPVTGVFKLHDGVDFGAPCGSPVRSPWAGEVVSAGHDGAYGYRVVVQHSGTRTAYAHLQSMSVSAGDAIPAGATVGEVGSTGLSTGCHLHWMAWRGGALVDPLTLLSG